MNECFVYYNVSSVFTSNKSMIWCYVKLPDFSEMFFLFLTHTHTTHTHTHKWIVGCPLEKSMCVFQLIMFVAAQRERNWRCEC